jgi:methylated-DNA-[protein]-cysteine S-methyltransferase
LPSRETSIHIERRALTELWFPGDNYSSNIETQSIRNDSVFGNLHDQLDLYFKGVDPFFDIPLEMAGTEFQRKVWNALREIPYGTTWSYAKLARHIGQPKAVRAVGAANGKNPIPIIVPCHRVIGEDGGLVGYGGGLPIKEYLLRLERIIL